MDIIKKYFYMRISNRKFFKRSLVWILMISVIPTILIAMSSYLIGTEQIEKQVNNTHQHQLLQMSDKVNYELSQLEMAVRHWSYNPLFGDYLRDFNHYDNESFARMRTILNNLDMMERSNPLIERVDLYVDQSSLLFTNQNGISSSVSTIVNEQKKDYYQKTFQSKEDFYWVYGLENSVQSESTLPTTLIQKIPAEAVDPVGALFIVFNRDEMNRMIKNLSFYPEGISLLMNPEGELIAVERMQDGEGILKFEHTVRNKIIEFNTDSGSFVEKWNGRTYVVSYGLFPRTGWKYVICTELSNLMKPVEFTSKLMIVMAVLIFIIVIFSWFVSNRLYEPIQRLLGLVLTKKGKEQMAHIDEIDFIEKQWTQLTNESQTLQAKLEQNLTSLRESFLYRFLSGHFNNLSEHEIKDKLELYGWDLYEKGFIILNIQLSGIYNNNSKFSGGDEQLVTFATSNIICELSQSLEEEVEVINLHDLSFGLLVFISKDKIPNFVQDILYRFSNKIIYILSSVLRMDVTIVHSKVHFSLRDIPEIFEQTRRATRYRKLLEPNQLLDVEDLLPRGDQDIVFPFATEKEIMQAIRIGSEDEVAKLMERFLQQLEDEKSTELLVQEQMLQLLANIRYVIMQLGFNPNRINKDDHLFEQLMSIREPSEMLKWIHEEVIQPYMKALHETQDHKLKPIIENVMETIKQKYMLDISLEFCADLHGLSPYILSKAFRKITGLNFIDYLTTFRLTKSKELLQSTDIKINEIAEMIGYQVTYFNKIFKKYEQMTPTQYRTKFTKVI